jgi:mycofactocin precursor
MEPTTEPTDLQEREIEAGAPAPELVEEDLVVEEVSIDGMCGVY